ncbi:Peptidase_M23 domain-containing protein [Agreia sp. COWG]|nr:Peptidase_M23 domain-containing protein [Agreia sp. COWG]
MLSRRAARAAGITAPIVLTEAQELEAERQAELLAFEKNVRPRGRRAAASTEQLASSAASGAAFDATEPELVPAGIAESVTLVSAVDVTAAPSATDASDSPASISLPKPVDDPSAASAGDAAALALTDVLGEVPAATRSRQPGRRASSSEPDDTAPATARRVGRRAAVDAPRSARDASGSGSGEAAIPSSRRRRPSTKMIAQKSVGAFAFLLVAGMAVATSLPAEAYFAATPNASISQSVQAQAEWAASGSTEKQQITTDASAPTSGIQRDGYSIVEVPKVSMAGFNTADTFSNDTSGTIQWPFPTGVPISDGFGYRSSPGGIGSTNHQGIDFNPGMGAPVQAIADGVVRVAQKSDAGGYGCYVIIDHTVNGMKFASLYGHMQCNSITVSKGDTVKVGEQIGKVGSTGTSTGAHLHFEIHTASDTPIDPMPWLNQYAN